MRQRKQRDVAKENEFYMQLMQQALPIDSIVSSTPAVQPPPEPVVSTAIVPAPVQNAKVHNNKLHEKNGHIPNGTIANGIQHTTTKSHHRKSVDKCKEHDEHQQQQQHRHSDKHIDRQRQVNHSHSNGTAIGAGCEEVTTIQEHESRSTRRREKKEQDKDREATEYLQKLEADAKRLRMDLQSSRASEQELRLQVGLNKYK